MNQEICICGFVEACHPSETCAEFESQGLILNTVDRILSGNGIKPEYLLNPIVIDRGMLDFLRSVILSLRRLVRRKAQEVVK